MDDRDKNLISEFKKRLPEHIKKHFKKLVFYGSRARGEADNDADLDLLVLVDEKTQDIEKELEEIVYQVMWEHDFKPIISLKIFSEAKFNHALEEGFSFYKNVKKEGVLI